MRRFILTAFILFLSFFGIKNVHAIEENTKIGDTNFYTPPYATFADISNGYATRYEGTSSHNVYYAPSNLITNGADSDGMGVAFSHESLFIQGYYYSVTLLVGFSDANIYPKATNNKVCISHNLTSVISSFNSGSQCTSATVYTWDNVSPFTTYDGTQIYLGMITYIFTSPATAKSFIGVCNSSARKVGYQIFGGAYVEQLADNKNSLSAVDMHNILNHSGLASASSINQVQSSLKEVKEEMAKQSEEQKKTNEKLDKIDDTINNTDITGASGSAGSFFENFQDNDYGLSDIITMPLTLIKSLTSSTCVSLKLTIPFLNKNLELPCMSEIYSQYFGSFFTLYQTITFGFVAYWVIVRIFALVKGFKDPDNDKVEVMDL